MKILLAGATGLVGQALLERLVAMPAIERIDVVVRRPLAHAGPKVQSHIGPIADWPTMVAALGPDIAISALGTTIRQAGSADAFKAVDHDAVLCFARSARASGARHMMTVSSVGAHAGSRNFYLSVKGQTEADLSAVGFDRLDIMRPGLLRGQRQGDVRWGERIASLLSPVSDFLTPAVLDHYRSIRAVDVAAAMAALTTAQDAGVYFQDNRDMLALAGR